MNSYGIIEKDIDKNDKTRLIFDLRKKYEYDNGHIEGSSNIIPDINILNKIPKICSILFVDR